MTPCLKSLWTRCAAVIAIILTASLVFLTACTPNNNQGESTETVDGSSNVNSTGADSTTEHTESSKITEDAETTEQTEPSETTEATETTEQTESSKTTEVTEATEQTESSKTTEVTEATDQTESEEYGGSETQPPCETDSQESESDEAEEQLEFVENGDGATYSVVGIGTYKGKDVVIPKEYKGKPVTAIADGAFAGEDIESVTISTTLTKIGNGAFEGCNGLSIYFAGTKKQWIAIDKSDEWNSGMTDYSVYPGAVSDNDWGITIG